MWLFPMPTKEDLHKIYTETYYSNKSFFSTSLENIYGYYDFISERLYKQITYSSILGKAKQFLNMTTSPGLLDIGCGLGHMLDVAFEEGFDVEGIEFNPYAVERIKKKYIFPVYCGDISSFTGRTFDVITMFDVIEHLMDPFTALENIRKICNIGGLLIITTMDSDSLTSRLLGKRLEDFRRIREHLFFFTRKSMTRILEEHGFKIIKINSLGHTFRLDFLADRIRLISPAWGAVLKKVVKYSGIKGKMVHINPLTKMIIYAKRVER
jgi:2-polyprenyl-3-methyl-5-hydroxy-6-metoxy-1,4-benzoquinol methylase